MTGARDGAFVFSPQNRRDGVAVPELWRAFLDLVGENQEGNFQHVRTEISNTSKEMRDAEWKLDRQVWG